MLYDDIDTYRYWRDLRSPKEGSIPPINTLDDNFLDMEKSFILNLSVQECMGSSPALHH
jgi:hypothetical protein